MLDKKSKAIGGHTYEVTQLNALQGRRVFTRFAKIAMPAVAALKGGSDSVEEAFTNGLAVFADRITEDDLDFFCDAFAPSTSVKDENTGKAPKLSDVFAVHFAGKYDEMLKWLYFCLEVNFSSFFEGLAKPPAS
jgi:hypothetical protein